METFGDVRQERFETSAGGCDLPILYRDGSLLGLFFLADLRSAESLLEGLTIEPWPLMGKALISLFAWEYRDSTVGSYGEIGVGIQARRRGSKPSLLRLGMDMTAQDDQGVWVVNLPVTTKEAFAAGVELWGYPKYVTAIDTEFDRGATARLGGEIEMHAGPMRGPRTAGFPIVSLTQNKGELIRTVITVKHRVRWDSGAHSAVKVLGDGPTAQSVRLLGLDRKKPLAVFRTDTFRATLPAGRSIGPAKRDH